MIGREEDLAVPDLSDCQEAKNTICLPSGLLARGVLSTGLGFRRFFHRVSEPHAAIITGVYRGRFFKLDLSLYLEASLA